MNGKVRKGQGIGVDEERRVRKEKRKKRKTGRRKVGAKGL